ncbi:trypsin-like serine protease [Pendulispora rubella]|uniref:Trypsin-like serine protease n=1 Tax=Pendulispora rubella TaxID=2741070 RepID=A0ABZ2KW62_9BACT
MHDRTSRWIPLRLALGLLIVVCGACGSSKEMRSSSSLGDAGSAPLALAVESSSPVAGAPSRGRDPAVLALSMADARHCTATALASNLVLTARICVAAHEPSALLLYGGEDPAAQQLLARGRELVVDAAEDASLALLILDRDLPETTPLPIRDEPAQRAERIRTVSFGQRTKDESSRKLAREHVAVTEVTHDGFLVAEATCQGDPGGVALDEGTGEVLGLVTQGGIPCDAPAAYTRVDIHRVLLEEAMAHAKQMRQDDLDAADAGRPRAKSPKKSRPATDVGQPCQSAFECTTGMCVREDDQAYCTRSCGSGDRCLTGFRCKEATDVKACIMSL